MAIEDRLATAGFVTLLGNTSEDRSKEERLLRTMQEFPADGILICPTLHGESSKGFAHFGDIFPGLVLHGEFPGSITSELTTSRVLDLRSNIFIESGIVGLRSWVVTQIISWQMDYRLKGYQQVLSQLKVKFDSLLVIPSDLNRRGGFDGVQEAHKSKKSPPRASF